MHTLIAELRKLANDANNENRCSVQHIDPDDLILLLDELETRQRALENFASYLEPPVEDIDIDRVRKYLAKFKANPQPTKR